METPQKSTQNEVETRRASHLHNFTSSQLHNFTTSQLHNLQ